MRTLNDHDMNELTHRVANVFDDILRTGVCRVDLNERLRYFLDAFGYAKVEIPNEDSNS